MDSQKRSTPVLPLVRIGAGAVGIAALGAGSAVAQTEAPGDAAGELLEGSGTVVDIYNLIYPVAVGTLIFMAGAMVLKKLLWA